MTTELILLQNLTNPYKVYFINLLFIILQFIACIGAFSGKEIPTEEIQNQIEVHAYKYRKRSDQRLYLHVYVEESINRLAEVTDNVP